MISNSLRGAMFAEETSDGLLVLLTITHGDLNTPIRIVNNNTNVISRGLEFIAFPFEIVLPTSSPDSPPKAQLIIDNISRELGQIIRTISSAPTVLIEVIRINDFNSLELSFPAFKLKNVRFDVSQVRGDLVSEDLQIEPYPVHTFSPANFPGLF